MTAILRSDGLDVDIVFRRTARARHLTLTAPRTGAQPRLTAPLSASEAEAQAFLNKHRDWLAAALSRMPDPRPVAIGAALPVAGRLAHIEAHPGPRRPPRLVGDRLLVAGGRFGDAGPRIEAWLKTRARAALSAAIDRHAGALGAQPGRLTLRDPKGRWGSCSARGDLSFSWRLAMAPEDVLDYVAAHEAAHLLEMNHGPRFWALVKRLRLDWTSQRDWLRRCGAELHLYRFFSR